MSAVESYLGELDSALRVRGRARRRFLAECREHLADAGAEHGADEAVRRFGDATEVARSFDLEVGTRRSVSATAVMAVGVAAVAASTLALVNAAAPGVSAQPVWALVFFAAAQTCAVAMVLAVLTAVASRYEAPTAAGVAVLCRRNGFALGFALLTLLAAGGAVPGVAPAWQLLAGPMVATVATAYLLRARSLVRRPRGEGARSDAWLPRPAALLAPGVALAVVAAFAWDLLDHGTPGEAAEMAAVEAMLVLAGFLVLGRSLGLWGARPTGP